MNRPNIGIIILAAGHGKRMKSIVPKVMSSLHGKPLVLHVLEQAEAAMGEVRPVVVVSPLHTLVQECLGDRAAYVVQAEQLGTGHAVGCAESALKGNVDHVVVVYGDMPFVRAASIQRLVARHLERDNTVTMMTVTVPNFAGRYAPFDGFSRVIRRSDDGHISRIVEKKDATAAESLITELNPSYYCFKSAWLWEHITRLNNHNAQKEYYLTDLPKMAIDEGEKISSIAIAPEEAVGVNTPDDLEVAHDVFLAHNHL